MKGEVNQVKEKKVKKQAVEAAHQKEPKISKVKKIEGEVKNEKKVIVQEKQSKKQQVDQKLMEKASKVKVEQKLEKSSKKIKKTLPPKENRTELIHPIIDDYSEFTVEQRKLFEKMKNGYKTQIEIDENLVSQAVQALIKLHKSKKDKFNLLDNTEEDFIYVEIVLSKVPSQYSIRPVQIPLKTPIYSKQYNSQCCIFVTDPQREFKDKIQKMDIPCIAKVQGFAKIIKKFPTYQDKRQLCGSHDLFFCDYRIYNLLRQPLGKIFYARKRFPFAIDCEKVPSHLSKELGNNYENYLNDLTKYSYFVMGNGPVYTLKVARVQMEQRNIVENISSSIFDLLPHLLQDPQSFVNLEQISIKTFNSISLPIFNQLTQKEIKCFMKK